MALVHSDYVRGPARVASPDTAGVVVAVRFKYTVTTALNVDGQIIELGVLPANCSIRHAILDSDDLDTGTAAITLDVGIMNGEVGEDLTNIGTARTMGAELFSASTVARAAVGAVAMASKDALRLASSAKDRSIGLKILAASAVAAEGEVGLTLFFST